MLPSIPQPARQLPALEARNIRSGRALPRIGYSSSPWKPIVKPDDALGMLSPITRRDFIGGVAASLAASPALAGTLPGADPSLAAGGMALVPEEPYPPLRTGLRGQYPGSFEVAHQARDGGFAGPLAAVPTGEHHDLVVVGAGISGLAAAHFYRRALGSDRRVLVLDNHDDFGGHAKRNEFRHQGRAHLSFGGSMSIESPFPYSYTAKALLAELGIDASTYARYRRASRLAGLSPAVFFDREHFRADHVVAGYGERPAAAFFAEAPLAADVRDDLVRLHTTQEDFLPGLDASQKADALRRMSYRGFLVEHARALPGSLPFFTGLGWGYRNNKRLDTCPAYEAWRAGSPGFSGMTIADGPRAPSDYFHFPDGNASIARLLVSRLVPQSFSGTQTPESVVLAPLSYAALDRPGQPVRIRLESTVVRVEHVRAADPRGERAVRVVYSTGGELRETVAANVILACFNHVIPFIAPELPDAQREALRYASKVPMQVTNVLLREWTALARLGASTIHAPNGYHTDLLLDEPTMFGDYASLGDPSQPAVVQLIRNPNKPGLPRREQHRVGRAEMLATPFEAIERATREQLQRMLGRGGFEAARDILAITVNRWPHGYAYTYDSLADPPLADAERPHVIGRQPFGRVAIANADSGAGAFVNVAIDQAERAVQECLASRGLK